MGVSLLTSSTPRLNTTSPAQGWKPSSATRCPHAWAAAKMMAMRATFSAHTSAMPDTSHIALRSRLPVTALRNAAPTIEKPSSPAGGIRTLETRRTPCIAQEVDEATSPERCSSARSRRPLSSLRRRLRRRRSTTSSASTSTSRRIRANHSRPAPALASPSCSRPSRDATRRTVPSPCGFKSSAPQAGPPRRCTTAHRSTTRATPPAMTTSDR